MLPVVLKDFQFSIVTSGSHGFSVVRSCSQFFEVVTSGCQWFLILTSGGSCSEGFPMVLSQFSMG